MRGTLKLGSRAQELPHHESIWSATATMPIHSSLDDDIHADIAIVGAGIAGLTTAYLLAQAGKSVVILEDGELASGMTQVTTAHLAADSHTAAIDMIEDIIRKEKINCDFERLNGYLFLAPGQDPKILDLELEAAHRAGLQGVKRMVRAPLEPFDTGPCLRFPNQAQFHPLKYLAALAKAIQRDGGLIFTHSHANEIEGGK